MVDKKEMQEMIRKNILTVTLAIMAVLLTLAFTGSSSAKTLNEAIDARVDQRVTLQMDSVVVPKLEDISKKLDVLVASSYQETITSLKKQYSKIQSDPGDIKLEDFEKVFREWKVLPSEYKTDDIIVKYEVLKTWYAEHTKGKS